MCRLFVAMVVAIGLSVPLTPARTMAQRIEEPSAKKQFRGVLPRRWVVERSFSWLGQSRRLSKDYERLCSTSEVLIYATMSRLMLRRLARSSKFSNSS